jgi:hypothetical protein
MVKDENETNYSPEKLKEMIAACVGPEKVPKQVLIHTDTTDFYRIDYDDVVVLVGRPYLVRNNEREGRFGIFGLGNILVYLAGRGDVTVQNLKQNNSPAYNLLFHEDVNIIFNNRLVNLKKVYPYIPDSLNLVMMHFSLVANVFYEDTLQFLSELQEAKEDCKP